MSGARQFGKLLKTNWGRDSWTGLTADAQWLYACIVSQSTTDTAGVFPVRLSKWAKCAADMTDDRVKAAAKLLVDVGWIVVDHDTEEGLLRNYLREDWAGDLVFRGALDRAALIQSVRLRAIRLSAIRALTCERPMFKEDQLSRIADLEESIPQEFDVESVVASLPPSPGPSPKPSPQAFERPQNAVQTPYERRCESDGGEADRYAEFDRPAAESAIERNFRDGYKP